MAKNKNRAHKAALQTSPGNKLPVPDAELAEEAGYRPDSNERASRRKK